MKKKIDGKENPWLIYNSTDSNIHPADILKIKSFNDKVKENFKYKLDLLPEPYIGNLDAKIIVLALNPGFNENDIYYHSKETFKLIHQINITQDNTEFPFYYLNPILKEMPGSVWWHNKLHWLIDKFEPKTISKSICCLQYTPYHSKEFKYTKETLETQKFTKKILESHMKRNSLIVLMRSRKIWTELCPALQEYKNVIKMKNPRNPTFSPVNLDENAYDQILNIISKTK
jgi:hypothetical protein